MINISKPYRPPQPVKRIVFITILHLMKIRSATLELSAVHIRTDSQNLIVSVLGTSEEVRMNAKRLRCQHKLALMLEVPAPRTGIFINRRWAKLIYGPE
jgi:hypothetical protein